MRIALLFLFFNCLVFSVCFSQSAKIEGIVRDESGNGLPLANIVIDGTATGVVADQFGKFVIRNLTSGKYNLHITSVGYIELKHEVEVKEREATLLEVTLVLEIKKLSEVVITATRSERQTSELPIPVTVISSKQIKSMGSLRLSEVLAEQTGLAIISDHGTGIQVQGFSPDYTLILLDGEPLIGRTSGTLDLTRLAVGNIKQIEMVKGPSSSLYGSEALAGVINIITEKPEGIRSTITSRYGTNNTLDVSTSASYKKEKFGAYVFADRYATDGYDLNSHVFGNTIDPYSNYTYQAKLSYDFSPRTKLSLSGRYFTEDQKSRTNIGLEDVPEIVSSTGSVKDWNINPVMTHRFTDKFKATFRYYSTGYKTNSLLKYEKDGTLYDESFFIQTFNRPEIQAEYFFNPHHIVTLGGGKIWESVEATRYDEKKKFESTYVYVQYEWKPIQRVNIIAGARYDAHSVYHSQFSPKLAAQYDILDWLSVRSSLASGYKAPDFRQLYLNFTNPTVGYSVFGSQEVANGVQRLQQENQINEVLVDLSKFGDIRAESSMAYNIGFNVKPTKRISTNINFFRNNIKDLIQTQAVARKANGQFVYSYFNFEKVFTQGVEVDARYNILTALSLSLGYQYLEAKDNQVVDQLKKGEVYARDPVTQATKRVTEKEYGGLFNRSKHTVNVKLFYENTATGLSANLRAMYRGRYGFGDQNGNTILDDDSEYVKGYLTLNASVAKSFNNILRIQIGCDNLTNYTNADYITTLPGRLLWASVGLTLSRKNYQNKF